MNKFWIVVMHTYSSKIKAKSFIISTLITLAIVLALTNMSKIIDMFESGEVDTIGVVDESGQYYDAFDAQIKAADSELKVEQIDSKSEGNKLVNNGDLVGYIVVTSDDQGLPEGVYHANSISDETINGQLSQALTNVKNIIVTQQLNISNEQMISLYEPAVFEKEAISENAKTTEELNQARGLVYILLIVIYIGVLAYAGMIATEVAGEKTSRVMEILISSVSPVQQMFGKILGVALVSLTQMLLLLGVGYFSVKQNQDDMNGGFFTVFGFEGTSVSVIIYAVVFTLLGYFLYATLAAFLGSLVSRVEDVQSMITPMTMLVLVGFFLAMYGLSNPEAGIVKVTSFIPFFSPMLMFLRIGMLEVPTWEIAVSLALLVGTIAALAVFGAKVYRGGVLMYGKTSSFKNIKEALNLTKKA
ncbi:ABC transporter permease [Bacillus sp. AGMB 02131]|uniref:ABC transporter permease n=1 Tax=Peribacillus faecalis TaxID=2772559 RepID=A0A927HAL1_9BACI|nr:ABC transporter permease [Peribacillus faecalis]MBD3108800.1 ABC transporter permease [Peribacillus faecalis]